MMAESAPAKVNLVLHVGPRRSDGLHELCSLFASLELADDVTVEPADADEVLCPGVAGPNLAQAATEAFRAAAGGRPPRRVGADRRLPVAPRPARRGAGRPRARDGERPRGRGAQPASRARADARGAPRGRRARGADQRLRADCLRRLRHAGRSRDRRRWDPGCADGAPARRRMIAALVVAALGAAVFTTETILIAGDRGPTGLDSSALDAAHRLENGTGEAVAKIVTAFGTL